MSPTAMMTTTLSLDRFLVLYLCENYGSANQNARNQCSISLRSNFVYRTGSSGQSYKQFTLVNYDSRDVPDLKTPHITTLGS